MTQPSEPMICGIRRARKSRLTLMVLIVLVGAFLLWPRHGPPYDESIEQWIDQAGMTRTFIAFGRPESDTLADFKQASARLRFWRGRVEPILIKRLATRDSSWSAAYGKIRALVPAPLAKHLPIRRRAISIRQSTVLAIGAMGSLSPRLEAALIRCSQDPDPIVRLSIALVLGFKGSPDRATMSAFANLIKDPGIAERLPSFMAGRPVYPQPSSTPDEWIADLDRPYHVPRYEAVKELAKCGGDPDLIVPALIHALDDQSELISNTAARALGRFGPVAGKALPALRINFASTTRITREIAREAITLIDVENHFVEPGP